MEVGLLSKDKRLLAARARYSYLFPAIDLSSLETDDATALYQVDETPSLELKDDAKDLTATIDNTHSDEEINDLAYLDDDFNSNVSNLNDNNDPYNDVKTESIAIPDSYLEIDNSCSYLEVRVGSFYEFETSDSAAKRRKSFATSYQQIQQDEGYSSFQSSNESDSCDENSSQSDDFNNNNNTLDKLDNINETLPWYESSDYDNDNEKQDKTDVSDEYEQSEQLSTDESESSDQLISTDEDDIETEKNNTESVDNEIDEDAERTKQGLLEWMDWVAKKLDFVHNFELEEEEEIEEDYLPNSNGRVCDPYIDMSSEDLADRIVEIRSYATDTIKTQLKGRCWLRMKNHTELHGTWRDGRRTGPGGIASPELESLGILNMAGNYSNGVLHGLARIQMADGSLQECWFQNGFLTGPVRGMCKVTGLKWIGHYSGGKPKGMYWKSLEGGSWLVHNQEDPRGSVFLYPDLKTALVGRWKDGNLVTAQPAKLKSWEILNDVFIPHCHITAHIEYRRWISSSENVMCPVHQQDPYESQNVEVVMSSIPGGGEGLFARKNLEADLVVCFYNGIRIQPGESIGRTGYGIYLDWENEHTRKTSIIFDIPEKYQSSEDYSATMGHKVNHSFKPNCDWVRVVHPCYGRIPAIVTLQKIKRGEELFVHYGMDMEEAPEWYLQSWEQYSDSNN